MKKKILLIIIFVIIIIIATIYIYFWQYKNAPEFSISLIPEFEIPQRNQTLMIFAPHPDDEILSSAGLIQKSLKNKAKVIIILLTNSDEHKFTTIEQFKKLYPTPENYIESGYTRQEESKRALKNLGVQDQNIIFLGYPDLGLKKLLDKNWDKIFTAPKTKQSHSPYNNSFHQDALYTGETLQNDIEEILKKYQPNIIVAPHPDDTHPDHAACFKFVEKAISNLNLKTALYFYLIHYQNFPNYKGNHPDHYLVPPVKLISIFNGWEKLSLDPSEINQKTKAIREYRTQLKSPLLKLLMEGFIKQNELFVKISY